MLGRIHFDIFESDEEYIIPWWIEKCEREIGTADQMAKFNKNKKDKLNALVSVAWLQTKWFKAFGSEDLKTSKEFLKLMMLFMIFGTELLNKDTLFDNGNLSDFLEATPCTKNRLWAFEKCFGRADYADSLKSKIVSIVDRFDYYSDAIL